MSFVSSISPIARLVFQRPDEALKASAKVYGGAALASSSLSMGGLLTAFGMGSLGLPLATSGSRHGAGMIRDGIANALAGAFRIRS